MKTLILLTALAILTQTSGAMAQIDPGHEGVRGGLPPIERPVVAPMPAPVGR